MSIIHFNEFLYCAGGWDEQHLQTFIKVNESGKLIPLAPMPRGKAKFPISFWEKGHSLVTSGGYDDFNLK